MRKQHWVGRWTLPTSNASANNLQPCHELYTDDATRCQSVSQHGTVFQSLFPEGKINDLQTVSLDLGLLDEQLAYIQRVRYNSLVRSRGGAILDVYKFADLLASKSLAMPKPHALGTELVAQPIKGPCAARNIRGVTAAQDLMHCGRESLQCLQHVDQRYLKINAVKHGDVTSKALHRQVMMIPPEYES